MNETTQNTYEGKATLSIEESRLDPSEVDQRYRMAQQIMEFADVEVINRLEYFQPQIGCVNQCTMCSQHASNRVEQLSKEGLMRVLGAMKVLTCNQAKNVKLGSQRKEHKPGVIFPYLDNDILSYPYLLEMARTLAQDFDSKVRLTSVGFNTELSTLTEQFQELVNDGIRLIDGFRLSATPYTLGYKLGGSWKVNYWADTKNLLRLAKPLVESIGIGKNNFCIEFRAAPLVGAQDIEVSKNGQLIRAGGYELQVAEDIRTIKASYISSFDNRRPCYSGTASSALLKIDGSTKSGYEGTLRRFSHLEGDYFFFDAEGIARPGRRPVGFYPQTASRKAGFVDLTRPLLNSIASVRSSGSSHNLTAELERQIHELAISTQGVFDDALYADLAFGFIQALQETGFSDVLTEYNFLVDTGSIVNQGRALPIFEGITKTSGSPFTPGEERGYGKTSYNSQRGEVWRIAPVTKKSKQMMPRTLLKSGWRNISPVNMEATYLRIEKLDGWLRPTGSELLLALDSGMIISSNQPTGPGMR